MLFQPTNRLDNNSNLPTLEHSKQLKNWRNVGAADAAT